MEGNAREDKIPREKKQARKQLKGIGKTTTGRPRTLFKGATMEARVENDKSRRTYERTAGGYVPTGCTSVTSDIRPAGCERRT